MERQTIGARLSGGILFLAILWGLGFAAEPPFPTPPAGHPRVWLRPGDLPEMKRRMADPFYGKAWKRVLDMGAVDWDGTLSFGPTNYDPKIHDVAEACALRYLLEGNVPCGEKAVGILRNALPAVTYPERQDITREKGATIHTAALVYDWCYPLLTASDKAHVIKHMKRIAGLMEIGYPPVKQGNVTGHAGEAQLFRDLMAGGIATHDEDPEMYRLSAPRLLDEMVPARNFFYPSGWHHQGSMYGPYRFQWEILSSWLMKRMSGVDIFDKSQGQIPYGLIYSTRGDGWPFEDGDGPVMLKRETRPIWPGIGDLLTASYYRDEVLMGYTMDRTRARDRVTELLAFFLLVDNTVKEKPWKSLPLSRYFGEPAGMLMARTGWEEGSNSAVVAAQMKIAPWRFDNHQHLDHGHFQLYYKGLLTGDSGIYQGTLGGYGCEHDINYYKRTIAHNCVTVMDPAEKFLWWTRKGDLELANDGGQNWPGGRVNSNNCETLAAQTNAQSGFHVGKVLGQGMGPDAQAPLFSWMTGDLRRAYSKKVVKYLRSFVFMNLKDATHPGALIVYDRLTTSDGKFQKKWLFHAPQEIAVEPAGFLVDGAWGGHLSASVLLPEASLSKMEIIGGEGKEFWVNGKNYPQVPKGNAGKPEDVENIGWRMELSDTGETTETRFLVAMQVMDKGTAPLPVQKISGPGHVGLILAGRCILFPKGYEDLTEVSLDLPPSVRHVLIMGATPGTWSLSTTRGHREIVATATEGALLFEASPGTVRLERTK